MDIDFGRVNGFTSELRQHLLGGDTSVVEFGLFLEVDSIHLSGNGLQHGRTTTGRRQLRLVQVEEVDSPSRGTENDKHLSSIEHTVDTVQDLYFALSTRDFVPNRSDP